MAQPLEAVNVEVFIKDFVYQFKLQDNYIKLSPCNILMHYNIEGKSAMEIEFYQFPKLINEFVATSKPGFTQLKEYKANEQGESELVGPLVFSPAKQGMIDKAHVAATNYWFSVDLAAIEFEIAESGLKYEGNFGTRLESSGNIEFFKVLKITSLTDGDVVIYKMWNTYTPQNLAKLMEKPASNASENPASNQGESAPNTAAPSTSNEEEVGELEEDTAPLDQYLS